MSRIKQDKKKSKLVRFFSPSGNVQATKATLKALNEFIWEEIGKYLLFHRTLEEALKEVIDANCMTAQFFYEYYLNLNTYLKFSKKFYSYSDANKKAEINKKIGEIFPNLTLSLNSRDLASSHNTTLKILAAKRGVSPKTIERRLKDAKAQAQFVYEFFSGPVYTSADVADCWIRFAKHMKHEAEQELKSKIKSKPPKNEIRLKTEMKVTVDFASQTIACMKEAKKALKKLEKVNSDEEKQRILNRLERKWKHISDK